MRVPLAPFFTPGLLEAGVDEVGRGCLAGPVVAAAVILPINHRIPALQDSKVLKEHERNTLAAIIKKEALCWAIGSATQQEIDEVNILQASVLAMHRALQGLHTMPQHILVDGNYFKPYQFIPYRTIVKGDGLYASIAAASIIAKTTRDALMRQLALDYPHYGWETNVGYPTPKHKAGIDAHGLSPMHRRSFCKRWLSLVSPPQ